MNVLFLGYYYFPSSLSVIKTAICIRGSFRASISRLYYCPCELRVITIGFPSLSHWIGTLGSRPLSVSGAGSPLCVKLLKLLARRCHNLGVTPDSEGSVCGTINLLTGCVKFTAYIVNKFFRLLIMVLVETEFPYFEGD